MRSKLLRFKTKVKELSFERSENQCNNLIDKYIKLILFFCPVMSVMDSLFEEGSSILVFGWMTIITFLTVLFLACRRMGEVRLGFFPIEILMIITLLCLVGKIVISRSAEK